MTAFSFEGVAHCEKKKKKNSIVCSDGKGLMDGTKKSIFCALASAKVKDVDFHGYRGKGTRLRPRTALTCMCLCDFGKYNV